MRNRVARWINHGFGRLVMAASRSRNHPEERVGVLNRLFAVLYPFRKAGRRLKQMNKHIYYLLKYLLFAGLIYLIVS